MRTDPRINAGVNLDGSMHTRILADRPGHGGQKRDARLDRPFLLAGAGLDDGSDGPHHHQASPDWQRFWTTLDGWKRDLYLPEGEHLSFTDLQTTLPQLDEALDLDQAAVSAAIGTIDPEASLAVQRAYLTAFFDQHLRGTPSAVLDAVPDTYPAKLIP